MEISEFREFFEEKKRDSVYVCIFCGNAGFSVGTYGPTAPQTAALLSAAFAPWSPAPSDTLPHTFYSISCDNCGRTDFFHVNQIDAWKAKKSEAK